MEPGSAPGRAFCWVVGSALSVETSKPASSQPMDVSSSLDAVLNAIQRRYTVDFRQYRRRFLARRVQARIQTRGVAGYETYARLIDEDPREYEALLEALSINVSSFLRDPVAFEALRDQALVPLLDKRQSAGERRLAIWSAGCSKGEEPYSIAMVLLDLLGAQHTAWRLELHASDVNEKALGDARRGWYPSESFNDPAAGYVERYFSRVEQGYQIAPEVQNLVSWYRRDLRKPPLLPHYDVILCRNVLIYYDRVEQEAMVRHLLDHLSPGGYLMLGMAEMVPFSQAQRLAPVNGKVRLHRKIETFDGHS